MSFFLRHQKTWRGCKVFRQRVDAAVGQQGRTLAEEDVQVVAGKLLGRLAVDGPVAEADVAFDGDEVGNVQRQPGTEELGRSTATP